MSASSAWPLFDLRVETPALTLRLPDDRDLMGLADQAHGRLLSAEQAHFLGPWAQLSAPDFHRGFMQYQWSIRASWKPGAWRLEMGVYPAGEQHPAGMMAAAGTLIAGTLIAGTGSWLLPEWRGRGLGKDARAAILHLLFDELGAAEARSEAAVDNEASLGVSRSLGYQDDGTNTSLTGGGACQTQRLLLTRERWERQRRDDICVEGLDRCRDLFGV